MISNSSPFFKAIAAAFLAALLLGAGLAPRPAWAQAEETQRVDNSLEVLKDIMNLPEKGLPPWLLSKAEALAIIPGVIKAAYVLGGEYGKGVIMIREASGRWSNPAFIKLAKGSFGWQIGVQRADIVLVFKSRESVRSITEGKFTLGATASVAAGPVGRSAEASTDVELKAEIYSYSRTKGLFAGLAISGASLSIDDSADAAFYGRRGWTGRAILEGTDIRTPEAAARLIAFLDQYIR